MQRFGEVPARIDRIDLSTGARTPVGQFAPGDRSGLVRIYFVGPVMKADASQYACGYVKRLSTLFVVTGADGR